MTRTLTALAACLRIFCALALVVLSAAQLAPTTVEARGIVTAEQGIYTLPDGTLPFICQTDTEEKRDKRCRDNSIECPALRIGSAILLPAPPEMVFRRIGEQRFILWPVQDDLFRAANINIKAPPRAPPAVSDA